MSKPVIFENAGFIKSLRASLNLNDTCKIIQGDPSPQVSAVDAPRGSLYLRTGSSGGQVFIKLDNGSSTNWEEVGTGSGSGSGVNYVDNPTFEVSTTGWATYADAAAATPADGTGGSANITLTLTPSSPLRGVQSGLITKDAANRQGQGVSYDFTIDKADKASPLKISFDYLPDTGTFAAGSDSTVGDLVVYVYDVTNAQLIQPTPYKLTSGSATIPGKFEGYFQSASNSTSYRLILHVASTSASAWTVQVDNFFIGPDAVVSGVPGSDWVSYTPTFNGLGTPTGVNFFWRRAGDSLEVKGNLNTGTTTASPLRISFPSGLSIDTTKTGSLTTLVGKMTTSFSATSGSNNTASIIVHSGQTANFSASNVGDGALPNNLAETNASTLLGSGTAISFQVAGVPIAGWSSNVQMSNDADTRVVAAKLSNSATSLVDATETTVTYTTTDYDSHGMVSAGNTFTIPMSGKYKVSALHSNFAGVSVGSANRGMELRLFKNGALVSGLGAFSWQVTGVGISPTAIGSTELNLVAGDTLQLKIFQNTAGAIAPTGSSVYQWFAIERLSGPATIAANEHVAARRNYSTGTTTISTAAATKVAFDAVSFDTHGAMDSTSRFVAPAAGIYEVHSGAYIDSLTAGQSLTYEIYKNGAAYSRTFWNVEAGGFMYPKVDDTIKLLAGDYVEIFIGSGGDTSYRVNSGGDGTYCFFSVTRNGF